MPLLLRPTTDSTLDALQERLPWSAMVGITNGNEWKTGVAADRHNVIITELLLRIAEYCDVPLVLGEQLCEMKLLATEGVELSKHTNSAGDGLIYRADGMRIIIELTASVSSNFENKVNKWVRFLAEDQTRSTAVIFVEAPHPDRANYHDSQLRSIIVDQTSNMDAQLNDVSSRIMVAHWTDWFPSLGHVNDEFFYLTSQRPTGPKGDRWESVDPLDPFDLSLPQAITSHPLLDNTAYLYGIPHWMKKSSSFDIQKAHLTTAVA